MSLHSGFARPTSQTSSDTMEHVLRADASLVGRGLFELVKKVRGEEDLPDEPLRARFTKDVALDTLNREEIGERLQRLTGEDPETILEMAGLPPKEQASIVRLAHFTILTANSTMDAQPVRQDQAAKDAAQAAVTLVEDAPPAPTPSGTPGEAPRRNPRQRGAAQGAPPTTPEAKPRRLQLGVGQRRGRPR
ncbi:PREDICTED: uncharacterized protein LOC109461746, partial [Branchiostoma belcheri]|uniref:Uncharacterized protein LOC109461746 n=1 Tax=Branchiostoma belcheri TaxID=7741 RepID=A0A6P4YA88_BRABE